MYENKGIVVISDGTGKTAKRLMDAVLAQYSRKNVQYSLVNIYQQIRDEETLDRILQEIDTDCLVIYSIISNGLSRYFHERLSERGILHLNVLEPMLSTMSQFLGVPHDYQPGILQAIDDEYYKKIDAIGYTVEHDDGRGALVGEADIVLVGPSRTCKTPISMYLACNYGMKVANIPIVPNTVMKMNLLARLEPFNDKQHVIFGLTMRPDVLARVREARLPYLASGGTSRAQLGGYCDPQEIMAEFRFCQELCEEMGWHVIDVTRRAIEEISQDLLSSL